MIYSAACRKCCCRYPGVRHEGRLLRQVSNDAHLGAIVPSSTVLMYMAEKAEDTHVAGCQVDHHQETHPGNWRERRRCVCPFIACYKVVEIDDPSGNSQEAWVWTPLRDLSQVNVWESYQMSWG